MSPVILQLTREGTAKFGYECASIFNTSLLTAHTDGVRVSVFAPCVSSARGLALAKFLGVVANEGENLVRVVCDVS